MKSKIYLILLLFFIISGVEKADAQSSFQKVIAGTSGRSIINTSDGGYAVCEGFMNSTAGYAAVAKFNSSGALQWYNSLSDVVPIIAGSIVQTSDGGYVITGRYDYWNFQILVIKLDSNGNLLWSKIMNDGSNSAKGICVIETKDRGILMGARSSYWNGYGGFLIKMDNAGNVLWTNENPYFGDGIYSVLETTNGDFILAGMNGVNSYDLVIARVDSQGNALWTKAVGGNSFDGSGQNPNMLVEANDGGFVVTGFTGSFGAGQNDLYAAKFSATGNLVWTRTVGGQDDDYGEGVIRTNDSGFLIAGSTTSFGAGQTDAYLVKLDSNGSILWTKTYGGTGYDGASDVVQVADSGFVFTGSTDSFSGSGIYLVKTDKNGNVCGNSSVATSFVSSGGVLSTPTGWVCCWTFSEAAITPLVSSGTSVTSVCSVSCITPMASIISNDPPAFCQGGQATLYANLGSGYTYQWKNNGNNIIGATAVFYSATTSGNYTCAITNSCGSTTSNTISVTVNNPPVITQHPFNGFVCAGSNTLFSITATGAGLTYQWQENGVNISNGGVYSGAATATLTLTGVPSFYDLRQYRCVVSGTCSPSQTSNGATLSVGATTSPAITITGPSSICAGSSVNFSAFPMNAGLSPTYEWKKNGVIVATNILTYSTNSLVNGDVITCTLTNNDPCAPPSPTTSNPITVTVTPLPTAAITAGGATTFCSGGSVTLNANIGAGLSYQWKNNGTNINGATSSSYAATASGNYTCVVTNSCGNATSNSITVTVNSTVAPSITISGPSVICSGSGATYTSSITNGGATPSYQWFVNGNQVATTSSFSSSGFSNGDNIWCTLTSIASCASPASVNSNTITVTVNSVPTASISAGGATTFCSGGSVTFTANAGSGLTYQWRNNLVNISGATLQTYSANASGSYTCLVTNSCGSTASNAIVVTVDPLPPASITAGGTTTFCSGGSVLLSANTGAGLTYQWKNNGNNIGGATSSSYSAVASGNYTCVVTNSCGSTTSNSITVTVNSTVVPSITISGPSVICQGSSATFTATVTNGGINPSYQWNINGVPAPGGTNSTFTSSILFMGDVITCTVTSNAPCASPASVTSNTIGVTVNFAPPASISAGGPTTFCIGGSVVLNANTGSGLSYQWKNNGVSIAGAVSSTYSATASGNYTCVVTNSCGNTTSNSIGVTVNPLPVASITAGGATTFCAGGSVTLNANTGSGLSYQWRNNGANIGGATASTYAATTTATYTCVVTNACGSTTSNTIAVSVLSIPATPGAITGQSSGICSITTPYSITPVAGATSHTWSVPTGVAINSGQGSASISVTYPSNFISGTIAVYAGNLCGNSSTSSLSLTRNLSTPGPISGSTSVCNGNTYSYSVLAVTGATNYNWTIPPKARIVTGQGTTLIRVKMNKFAGSVGVTASNGCVASSSTFLPVTITTVNCGPVRRDIDEMSIRIFPNPSATQFVLSMDESENPIELTVLDLTGRIVERYENVNTGNFEFGKNLASGIYLAEIIYNGERQIIRVVKNN